MRQLRPLMERDGVVVLEQFLTHREVDELRMAGDKLERDMPENIQSIFSTDADGDCQHEDKYFIESNDKVRYFLEKNGIPGQRKLNKVGHALHWHVPLFKYYTYTLRVKQVVHALNLREPTVAQSMYIYKSAHVGTAVSPHQDGTYLYTEPESLYGFWIALEDTTVENGCLWVAKGSHRSGVHRRLIRNPDKTSKNLLIYDRPECTYQTSIFEPLPVKKGDCVLLHGSIVHKSNANTSDVDRPAYTFHVVERGVGYSPSNWIQEGPEAPFVNIYSTEPFSLV